MYSRPSWTHKLQIGTWRERLPYRNRGEKEAGSRDYVTAITACPVCLASVWPEERGRSCNCIYKSWMRMRQAKGCKGWGGPFSSYAQPKPVRKHADSLSNLNERQTSGEQALRLWSPAGPSNREILPPLPTLQNLDMCLWREEKGFLLFCFYVWPQQ